VYSPERYVTRGRFSARKFENECLGEYAGTFPTVCGDFAFYQFPSPRYWAELFASVPDGFQLGLKVPEDITVPTWPTHARYGRRAGIPNEHFLSARIFERMFVRPLESYRSKLGPLIFEFGTIAKSVVPDVNSFTAMLEPFFEALPGGCRYAVEVRNPEYLVPGYFDTLARHGVAHVFNAWTRMPALEDQARLDEAFTAEFTVVRALLSRGRTYEQAVQVFQPYDRIQAPNEGARAGMVAIARRARDRGAPAFVFVNNRLEGCAPSTIEAVADEVGVASPRPVD
jgi:uncharacterized protein YecE (DUF72 family)